MTISTRTRWSAGPATTGGWRYEVFVAVRWLPSRKPAWRPICLTTLQGNIPTAAPVGEVVVVDVAIRFSASDT